MGEGGGLTESELQEKWKWIEKSKESKNLYYKRSLYQSHTRVQKFKSKCVILNRQSNKPDQGEKHFIFTNSLDWANWDDDLENSNDTMMTLIITDTWQE